MFFISLLLKVPEKRNIYSQYNTFTQLAPAERYLCFSFDYLNVTPMDFFEND